MTTQSIAIIIPAYNEDLTIKDVMLGFHQELPSATIYVIDNNSQDQTAKIALETFQTFQISGYVLSEKLQGKGFAVRRAFMNIDADIYVLVDADTTYSSADIHRMLLPVMQDTCDMVVGDRLSEGEYARANKRPFHNLGNNLVRTSINLLFKQQIRDVMSGYRVMNRFFVKNFPILSKGFEIETEMTLHALDKLFRIQEIPILYQDRPAGSVSKLNTVSDGMRVLLTIFNIFKDYRPFLFFSGLSVGVFVLGLLFGIPVFIEFFHVHFIHKVPSAVLASGLMVMALLLFAIGLILDTVVKNHRFNYYLWLLRKDA